MPHFTQLVNRREFPTEDGERADMWSEPESDSPLTPYSQPPANGTFSPASRQSSDSTFNQVIIARGDSDTNGSQSWAQPNGHNDVSTFSTGDNTVDNAAEQRVAAAATLRAARMEEGAEAEAKAKRETFAKATLHYETLQKVRLSFHCFIRAGRNKVSMTFRVSALLYVLISKKQNIKIKNAKTQSDNTRTLTLWPIHITL